MNHIREITLDGEPYWIDERDNKWAKGVHSRKSASLCSNRCKGCYCCTNCENCVGCVDCSSCFDCTNCTQCQGCHACIECSHMYHCNGCRNCQFCKRCTQCTYGDFLAFCHGIKSDEAKGYVSYLTNVRGQNTPVAVSLKIYSEDYIALDKRGKPGAMPAGASTPVVRALAAALVEALRKAGIYLPPY